ncbi:C40 family peptidase [Tumebacillus permanentifrigoris]|uniref:NlpC/P60 family protein n=1 Tax=Tumebacillus permanentifrigoris TaxID=378543 RepID=A0A316D6M5_9BACL|nr:C40 family peptidase [Tumebacillus permanentifrigoris]PWK11248.1 NlpC/P60 family protein [Tumebacillus permanentifrigoris]
MQRWKKGLFIGLFSSMLWEQQTVQAAIGLTAPKREQPFAPDGGERVVEPVVPINLTVTALWVPEQEPEPMESVTNHRMLVEEQQLVEQEELLARQVLAVRANQPPKLASRGNLLVAPKVNSQPNQPSSSRSTPESNPAPSLNQRSGATATQASRLATVALRYQGTPYVYGGTTPSGFDCSGFIQFVFQECGIALPRTTYQQLGAGSQVARAALQPGDLVFFSCDGQAASHAGIYLGDGTFIHADQSRGITITDLDRSYWATVYQTGVRVR